MKVVHGYVESGFEIVEMLAISIEPQDWIRKSLFGISDLIAISIKRRSYGTTQAGPSIVQLGQSSQRVRERPFRLRRKVSQLETSAAKSAKVTSISCPTAEMIGTLESCNGPNHHFFVKTPEILQGASTSPDDDDINAFQSRSRCTDGLSNLLCGSISLHENRMNQNSNYRTAALENRENIANGRSMKRSDNPNPSSEETEAVVSDRPSNRPSWASLFL